MMFWFDYFYMRIGRHGKGIELYLIKQYVILRIFHVFIRRNC